MKRLLREELKSLYIDPDLHKDLRIAAATEGKPIREIVERALRQELEKASLPNKTTRDAAVSTTK